MKKLISMLLAAVMLASMSAIVVSAEDEEDFPHLRYYYFGQNNGYDICVIDAIPTPMELCEVIGDYLFTGGGQCGGPFDGTAIYAVKGDEKIYIRDAYEQNVINLEEVVKMVDGFDYRPHGSTILNYDIRSLGDVNRNKKLEVADVLDIQKVVAKIKNVVAPVVLYDPNKDGEISVEDVLLLQKKIAKAV